MPSIKDKIAGLEYAAKLAEGSSLPSLQNLKAGFNALPPLGKEAAIEELMNSGDPLLRSLASGLGGSSSISSSSTSSVRSRFVSSGGGEGSGRVSSSG